MSATNDFFGGKNLEGSVVATLAGPASPSLQYPSTIQVWPYSIIYYEPAVVRDSSKTPADERGWEDYDGLSDSDQSPVLRRGRTIAYTQGSPQ